MAHPIKQAVYANGHCALGYVQELSMISDLISRRSMLALFGGAVLSITTATAFTTPAEAQPALTPEPPTGTERRVERRITRTERRQDRRIARTERRRMRREGRRARRATRSEGRAIRREIRQGM